MLTRGGGEIAHKLSFFATLKVYSYKKVPHSNEKFQPEKLKISKEILSVFDILLPI